MFKTIENLLFLYFRQLTFKPSVAEVSFRTNQFAFLDEIVQLIKASACSNRGIFLMIVVYTTSYFKRMDFVLSYFKMAPNQLTSSLMQYIPTVVSQVL